MSVFSCRRPGQAGGWGSRQSCVFAAIALAVDLAVLRCGGVDTGGQMASRLSSPPATWAGFIPRSGFRRQSAVGSHLEVCRPDSIGGGSRAGDGLVPARIGATRFVHRGDDRDSWLVVTLAAVQFFTARVGVGGLLVAGLIVVIAAIIPACVVSEKSRWGGRLDGHLSVYFAVEMVFTLILWKLSTGGWYNYAIQAVVLGCVLTGRALARACDGKPSWRPLRPAALAALAVPLFAWTDANQVVARRSAEKSATTRLLAKSRGRPARYSSPASPGITAFTGESTWSTIPGFTPFSNRSVCAEPRSIWLEPALATGPVHCVVMTSGRTEIDGLNRSLAELGYSRSAHRTAISSGSENLSPRRRFAPGAN